MKRVALINDISGYGKCSITTQMPIISAFGDVPACCITSYLSNHTAYENKFKKDLNDTLPNVLEMWNKNNFKFDAVLTGYIGNAENILNVKNYLEDLKIDNERTLLMVDPVFAVNGKLYCEMTDTHIENYKKLAEMADILTPNITEACMLTGVDYESIRVKCGLLQFEKDNKEKLEEVSKKVLEAVSELYKKLIFKRTQITLITGIELFNAVCTILDIFNGDLKQRQTSLNFAIKQTPRCGTGDLLDAVFLECFLNGLEIVDCLNVSSSFVQNALRFTNDNKFPVEEGIIFEPILIDNMNAIRDHAKKVQEERNKKLNNNNQN